MGRDADTASQQKQGYHVENRWGDTPWWLIYYFDDGRAKVISKHPTKPAARTAERKRRAS